MRPGHCAWVVALLLVLGSDALAAEGDWYFAPKAAVPIAIPEWLPADSLLDALEYEPADSVAGLVADLNRDGVADYLFSYSLHVCGSNCQFDIVDGRTHRLIGLVGGSVIVIRGQLVNGQPVINTYGHGSADSGTWGAWVFDGSTYVSVLSVYVERESQKRLFETLKGLPYGAPAVDR